jgi:hypothetical protein
MTSFTTSKDFPDRRHVEDRGAGQEMQGGRSDRPQGNHEGDNR